MHIEIRLFMLIVSTTTKSRIIALHGDDSNIQLAGQMMLARRAIQQQCRMKILFSVSIAI